MVRKAVGYNQYRHRFASVVLLKSEQDLVAQAAAQVMGEAAQQRCGDVWGTECRAWVDPPHYSHAGHGLNGSLRHLADSPTCPPWAMQILVDAHQEAVRINLAANPQCPPDLLERLAGDPHPLVNRTAVRHPKCPAAGLWKAARNPKKYDRLQMVANNDACPAEILEYLADDPRAEVRRAVVRHPNCPLSALQRLISDKVLGVRLDVAMHPRATTEMLAHLLPQAPDDRLPPQWPPHLRTGLRWTVAAHPAADPDWLDVWAHFQLGTGDAVQQSIAENPATRADTLRYLLSHYGDDVRRAVLRNPNCPEEYRHLAAIASL